MAPCLAAPEQGEEETPTVYYEPLVESMQEVKVENNSFSGGVRQQRRYCRKYAMKSGTNAFHGSGWYFCSVRKWMPVISSTPSPIPNLTPDATREGFRSVTDQERPPHFFLRGF